MNHKLLMFIVLSVFIVLISAPEPSCFTSAVDNYIWVTDYNYYREDGGDTVSKIDKSTNTVIATIPVGTQPHGVAVDPLYVWVTNHFSNTVSKIRKADNSVIANINVGIYPSGIAVDPYYVWVTNEGSNTVSKIDKITNTVVATIPVNPSPYGTPSVDNNFVWVASYNPSNTVQKIDKITDTVVATIPTGGSHSFELAGDFNFIWVVNMFSDTITKINKVTDTVVATINVGVYPHGIAVDNDYVWVTNLYSNTISKISKTTDAVIETIPTGDYGPRGISLDNDFVWTTIFGPNVLLKIDKTNDSVVAAIPAGQTPLMMGDGTGYSYDMFFQPPNQAPVAQCQNRTFAANQSCTADALIDNGSYDPDSDPITLSQSQAGPYALGDTSVTLTVLDDKGASSQCIGTVTVTDNSAPMINNVSVSPSILWPPNNKMIPVTVNYSTSDNCGIPTCSISSITSNEQIGTGYAILDTHHVKLNAQRSGSGSGRVYNIGITCMDSSGNSSNQSVSVTVPHDQRGK